MDCVGLGSSKSRLCDEDLGEGFIWGDRIMREEKRDGEGRKEGVS